eukprot:TRINITY_DN65078_c0_g1_i1.p1 TRINITY_DN65078_c0_g1~~TRINITY_DN65078_c0_g1_i1.p1  ORF type:complete len:1114 (+),score=256.66 TRINITY_DN65078_c0_g1_i1:85-3342(+)
MARWSEGACQWEPPSLSVVLGSSQNVPSPPISPSASNDPLVRLGSLAVRLRHLPAPPSNIADMGLRKDLDSSRRDATNARALAVRAAAQLAADSASSVDKTGLRSARSFTTSMLERMAEVEERQLPELKARVRELMVLCDFMGVEIPNEFRDPAPWPGEAPPWYEACMVMIDPVRTTDGQIMSRHLAKARHESMMQPSSRRSRQEGAHLSGCDPGAGSGQQRPQLKVVACVELRARIQEWTEQVIAEHMPQPESSGSESDWEDPGRKKPKDPADARRRPMGGMSYECAAFVNWLRREMLTLQQREARNRGDLNHYMQRSFDRIAAVAPTEKRLARAAERAREAAQAIREFCERQMLELQFEEDGGRVSVIRSWKVAMAKLLKVGLKHRFQAQLRSRRSIFLRSRASVAASDAGEGSPRRSRQHSQLLSHVPGALSTSAGAEPPEPRRRSKRQSKKPTWARRSPPKRARRPLAMHSIAVRDAVRDAGASGAPQQTAPPLVLPPPEPPSPRSRPAGAWFTAAQGEQMQQQRIRSMGGPRAGLSVRLGPLGIGSGTFAPPAALLSPDGCKQSFGALRHSMHDVFSEGEEELFSEASTPAMFRMGSGPHGALMFGPPPRSSGGDEDLDGDSSDSVPDIQIQLEDDTALLQLPPAQRAEYKAALGAQMQMLEALEEGMVQLCTSPGEFELAQQPVPDELPFRLGRLGAAAAHARVVGGALSDLEESDEHSTAPLDSLTAPSGGTTPRRHPRRKPLAWNRRCPRTPSPFSPGPAAVPFVSPILPPSSALAHAADAVEAQFASGGKRLPTLGPRPLGLVVTRPSARPEDAEDDAPLQCQLRATAKELGAIAERVAGGKPQPQDVYALRGVLSSPSLPKPAQAAALLHQRARRCASPLQVLCSPPQLRPSCEPSVHTPTHSVTDYMFLKNMNLDEPAKTTKKTEAEIAEEVLENLKREFAADPTTRPGTAERIKGLLRGYRREVERAYCGASELLQQWTKDTEAHKKRMALEMKRIRECAIGPPPGAELPQLAPATPPPPHVPRAPRPPPPAPGIPKGRGAARCLAGSRRIGAGAENAAAVTRTVSRMLGEIG